MTSTSTAKVWYRHLHTHTNTHTHTPTHSHTHTHTHTQTHTHTHTHTHSHTHTHTHIHTGTDNCQLRDEFLGYPDPRPYRTFANIRYALYEYWMRHYNDNSYILILDFRDTFFQSNPFAPSGTYLQRTVSNSPKYDLQMYAENYKVKNIGICVFNSNWIKTCFGKPALEALRKEAVICSGSTLGSYPAVRHYVRTMLGSMDSVQCWLKGIESDQVKLYVICYMLYYTMLYVVCCMSYVVCRMSFNAFFIP
jgi:hypothetical protein